VGHEATYGPLVPRQWNEVDPDTGDDFHVRLVTDGPFVVDFSINQWTVDEDGSRQEVWRADTAEAEVHEHHFQRGRGGRRLNGTKILPVDLGGPMQVAVAFTEYKRTMIEKAAERRRSWLRP